MKWERLYYAYDDDHLNWNQAKCIAKQKKNANEKKIAS